MGALKKTGMKKIIHKDVQTADATTAVSVWDPTSGYKFVVLGYSITTDTAMSITVLDEGTTIAKFYLGANGGVIIKMEDAPYVSTTADNILKIQASVAGNISIQVYGYEVK